MTNEKAIELLKMAVPQDESLDEEGLFIEAVSMAIKSLEQAPTAMDHIHNVVRDDAYKRGYEQAKEDCIKAVRDCYENILDVETDGHTIADSVEDIITERVRGTA